MKPEPLRSDQSELRSLVGRFLTTREEQTFRRIYRICTPSLYQFVFRSVSRSTAVTDEIVQETWVRTIERLREFRWDSSFNTWLTGIALNCCREHFRRREREMGAPMPESAGKTPALPEKIDLETAIASLPDRSRLVLILHDIEGFGHDEIAHLLQIEPGTSKSQLSRARDAIRNMLRHNKTGEYTNE